MFKNIIAPVQAWLLSQGKCVGCGMPLSKSKIKSPRRLGQGGQKSKEEDLITCKCRRVFVYNKKTKTYRRAKLNEV